MPETILTCIKQMIGLTEDYTPYDRELVMHINSVLMILDQLGVGKAGFRITLSQQPGDDPKIVSTETWNDFFGSSYQGDKEAVKSYIFVNNRIIKTCFVGDQIITFIPTFENIPAISACFKNRDD